MAGSFVIRSWKNHEEVQAAKLFQCPSDFEAQDCRLLMDYVECFTCLLGALKKPVGEMFAKIRLKLTNKEMLQADL